MDERKEYWNKDYFEYWKKRVEESNNEDQNKSALVKNDAKASSDDNYLEAIGLVDIKPGQRVLEMGCGFGRSLPYLYERSKNLYALDISEAMVKAAKENFSSILPNVEYFISESENTPFETDFFDVIICYASFDAMYQEKAMAEFFRIMKQGGKILFTGKNDNYADEDELAYVAEVNARKKGHPNYFTNASWLYNNSESIGFKVLNARFFEKRGDISENNFTTELPSHFYEYLFVLQKAGDLKNKEVKFADKFSKTFKRKEK